jgi:glycosyltransferase involved in cell wall biosynthesis
VREALAALRERPALAAAALRLPLAPWQLEVLFQAMAPTVRAAVAERAPDVALVVWDLAAAWREHLPDGVPAAIALHDASWAYEASRAGAASTRAAATWHRLEAVRLRRFAARRLAGYEAVVCVSAEEAGRVCALVPAAAPVVVPNGVDLGAFAPAPEPRGGPPTVLFTGTMNYPPNAEGAAWLAHEVWPRVRAARPDARLLVVGRAPAPAVRALDGHDGVEVAGGVPDMAPWFAAAHAVAVPIRSGGGTRLKVLEAAASGRAVVSTALGAEGLALEPGREIVVADAPGAFADALLALLADGDRRHAIAAAARAVAEERYGWPALGDRLGAVLEEISAARTAAQ